MRCTKTPRIAAAGLVLAAMSLAVPANATTLKRVPLEALGIEGGHLVSLDMSPSEFAAAPTWRDTDAPPLPNDAIVRVALSRS
jgi:hypothetical protein